MFTHRRDHFILSWSAKRVVNFQAPGRREFREVGNFNETLCDIIVGEEVERG